MPPKVSLFYVSDAEIKAVDQRHVKLVAATVSCLRSANSSRRGLV